jgi:hypothetical protein
MSVMLALENQPLPKLWSFNTWGASPLIGWPEIYLLLNQ